MKAKVNIQDILILLANAEITKNPNSTYHDVYPIVKKAIQTAVTKKYKELEETVILAREHGVYLEALPGSQKKEKI